MNRRLMFKLLASVLPAAVTSKFATAEPGTPTHNQGCACISKFTQELRTEMGDSVWVDHVNLVLENGKTHMNGRFTVTVYKHRYPDRTSWEQCSAAYCPLCGAKYPVAHNPIARG